MTKCNKATTIKIELYTDEEGEWLYGTVECNSFQSYHIDGSKIKDLLKAIEEIASDTPKEAVR